MPCSDDAKTQNPLKFAGVPKLTNRSQPLVGRSSPCYQVMRRRYCCLTSFFPIVDTCLSSEDIARQSCAMVPKWRFFASCIFSKPRADLRRITGVPQTRQHISAASGPKFTILSGHVEEALLFNIFFWLSIHALVAKISSDKVVRWCPDGAFLGNFLGPAFPVSHMQHISNMHSKFALRPHHV